MAANLGATRGAIFSESILPGAGQQGRGSRQRLSSGATAGAAGGERRDGIRKLILEDKEIRAHLSEEEIAECFSLVNSLKRVDEIFARVGLS